MTTRRSDRSLPDPSDEPTISVLRAGRILGMGRNAAYAAARNGRFPTVPIGSTRVVVLTAEFLDRYRLSGTTAPATPPENAADVRITAHWQVDPVGRARLILTSHAWPQLRPEQRDQIAQAAADATEAAIGIALGDAGIAS